MLSKLFDNTKPRSLANKFRRRRFRFFLELIENKPQPVNILDIGGTEVFWIMMGFYDPEKVRVTIINTENIDITLPNFTYIQGDARELSMLHGREFDVIFSNSVIEHVNNYLDQKKMASEIIRTGKNYFVQTPNFYFPFEPHFMFPLFQFLPMRFKVLLLTNFNLGCFKKCDDKTTAVEIIKSIRLLKKRELISLFPDAKIHKEKFLFLTKSYTMHK